MFNEFDVKISADGRRIIGRRIRHPSREESTTESKSDSTITEPGSTATIAEVIMAAKFNVDEAPSSKAETKKKLLDVENEIFAIESSIQYYTKKEKDAKRKYTKWNRASAFYLIASGLLGFFIGLTYGIYEILHTFNTAAIINFSNIIGMSAICFAIGIVSTILLVCISRVHSGVVIKRHKKSLDHARIILERLRASKKAYCERQQHLTNIIAQYYY